MYNNLFFRRFNLQLCLFLFAFQAFALDSGISYAVYSTGEQPYVEVNLEIAGTSLMWKSVDSLNMQAEVQVTILLQQGDKVANYEKYLLQSPTVNYPISLLDVRRLAVPTGDYDLEVLFVDQNDTTNRRSFTVPVKVDVSGQPFLSEIQLLRSFEVSDKDDPFVKNGFYMKPLPFMFYDKDSEMLAFYAEIYNTKNLIKDKKYLVRYFIEHELGNDRANLVAIGSQRRVPSDMDAVLMQMDISELESGNYNLTVEIRTTNSEKLAEKKIYFQRSNPYLKIKKEDLTPEALERQFVQDLDIKQLEYCMRGIIPVAAYSDAETINTILKSNDVEKMRFYVFNYFIGQNPNNPKAAYDRYMDVVKAVDNTYKSGFGHGFESDRGITFLRYGKPDDVVRVDNEPSAPPYEIWIYYKLNRTLQSNVKFLFYNPSLSEGDFLMLHSTARGERSNPRWEVDLYKRNAPNEFNGDNYHDATTMQGNNYRVARQYFDSF